MLNIGIIGGSEFILGFQLAGIKKTYDIQDKPEETMRNALQDPEIGILIVDDALMPKLDERTKETVAMSVQPVCIQLSTEAGAQDSLRKMIRKSIGIDLWKE